MNNGRAVVTYIQTKARKIVLPIAIFFNNLNGFQGTFGAEYKKVSKPAMSIQMVYSFNLK